MKKRQIACMLIILALTFTFLAFDEDAPDNGTQTSAEEIETTAAPAEDSIALDKTFANLRDAEHVTFTCEMQTADGYMFANKVLDGNKIRESSKAQKDAEEYTSYVDLSAKKRYMLGEDGNWKTYGTAQDLTWKSYIGEYITDVIGSEIEALFSDSDNFVLQNDVYTAKDDVMKSFAEGRSMSACTASVSVLGNEYSFTIDGTSSDGSPVLISITVNFDEASVELPE